VYDPKLCVNISKWWDTEGIRPEYLFRHLPTGYFYVFMHESQCKLSKEDALRYLCNNAEIKCDCYDTIEIIDLTTQKAYTVDEFYDKN